MTAFDFNETLPLSRPINLTPVRDGGPSVYLYFSTIVREGAEFSVFISLAVQNTTRTRLHGHGTRAHVVGSSRTVHASIWVSARCILPLETPIYQPEFLSSPSLLWPGLILGGVVSSTQLTVLQPKLRLESISITRQDGSGHAAALLSCKIDDAGLAGLVILSGQVDDYTDDSLTISVRDASFAEHPSRLSSAVSAVSQWIMHVLHSNHSTQATKTVPIEMDMNPTFLRLAVDDSGCPYGEGWPQIIISPRRTPDVVPPQPATINLPVGEGSSAQCVRT